MQRLYFLTPNKDVTLQVANELDAMGLTKEDVHIVGKQWKPLEREGFPNATLRQSSDVVKASRRGLLIGAVLGAVLGVVIHFAIPAANLPLLLLGMTLFGALFGLWSSAMIGVSVRDVKISQFEKDLKHGRMLMLVDVPDEAETKVKEMVHRHHPEVVIDKVTPRDRQKPLGEGQ